MIVEELKQRIILKAGLTNITGRDCRKIALGINQSLNKRISVTTLKRVFGFIKSTHQPSRYTIATLKDYADQPVHLPTSELSSSQPVLSFMTKKGTYLLELDDENGLHPQQLVLEAIEILRRSDDKFLPLVTRGKCVGVVYFKDLESFLAIDENVGGTLFHKFNFSVQSAIDIMQHKKYF
uniref:hypothetical protein n=1 Tax=Pedobacter schmidteae TaxID=2201271 RepID=UPI000EB53EFD|nr:hypothetical protein [Pedobacter schmidteae]